MLLVGDTLLPWARLQHGTDRLPRTTSTKRIGLRRTQASYAGSRLSWRLHPRFHWLLLLLLASIAPTQAALAEATTRDLQVLARALGFLEGAPRGAVEVGIVYPQQSGQGRAEAERVAKAFGDGMRAGSLTLHPKLVTVETVAQAGTVALLLTESAVPHATLVARAIAGRSILTVTTDRGLIDTGTVVLTVRAEPRVEILVSRTAAQAAGITFVSAFRMMIQER